MNILAQDGKFMVGLGFNTAEYRWNKDKTLTIWVKGKSPGMATVAAYGGTFVEALDAKGNVVAESGDQGRMFLTVTKSPLTLRIKQLPKPKLTKGELDKKRSKVTRYLVSDAPYSIEGLPGTVSGMIRWLEKQLKAIPGKSRTTAKFEFTTEYEYGESYPRINITYEEPETDAELIKRLQVDAERGRLAEKCERAKLILKDRT